MTKTNKPINFPIDLVYLWVDGSDPAWIAKRNKAKGVTGNESHNCEARWRDNDELKYSLRSIEKFAPWVNRVFIVTDNQCPSWLDASNPKVQVVDHSQIFPADALPIFNSQAIESVMYKIPGLSEHFIYGNDDMLLAAPVEPSDFFNEDGTTIVRLSGTRMRDKKRFTGDMYVRVVHKMRDYIYERFGVKVQYKPHHNLDAYRVSDFEKCVELCPEAWKATAYSRFRSEEDVQRSIVGYFVIATGRGTMRKVGRCNRFFSVWSKLRAFFTNTFASDSRCVPVSARDYAKVMRKYNPLMFCMNDDEKTSEDDCKRMAEFLEKLFPEKSSFEK